MKYCELDRSEFTLLLSDLRGARNHSLKQNVGQPKYAPMSRELLACWRDTSFTGDNLPRCVVVADDDLNDFLAWAVNFVSAYRPITSFMRVISWSVFTLSREKYIVENLETQSALIGAILGETLTNSTDRQFMEALPLTALESTYSYAMSRALFIGYRDNFLTHVSDGWHKVREYTEQPARKINPTSLADLWTTILHLTNDKNYNLSNLPDDNRISIIREICKEISTGNDLSNKYWKKLSDGRISDASISATMRSTKEHRVEAFDSIARMLSTQLSDDFYTSFLIGYLASMVSGGSLEHAHLILPLQNRLPSAMLWYGVCAGLLPDNRILTDYNHLGLRILRSLKRDEDILSIPSCDISLAELGIILRGTPQSRGFRQAQTSFLRVEIFPMITTVVRWPGGQISSGQLRLFDGDEQRIQDQEDLFLEKDSINKLLTTLHSSLSIAESLLNSKPHNPIKSVTQTRGKRRK